MRRPRLMRSAPLLPGALRTVFVAVFVAACSPPENPTNGVLLDGLFDEWTDAATLIDDPPDAPESPVDILSVQALDDPAWLYLALDVGSEVALQALPGTLHLLVDGDGDRSTGGTTRGMSGVDLIVDLSQTSTPLTGGRGAGFAIRSVAADGSTHEVERDALGLMAAPTWAAPRFELRLARGGADGVPAFERSLRLKAVYTEMGIDLDETDVGSFVFGTRRSGRAPVQDVSTRLERADDAYRVATWNVASRSFTSQTRDFARTLAALGPDVVVLDELPGDVSSEALEAFFASSELSALGTWHFVLGSTGGVQRVAIAARDHAVAPAGALTRVPYPEGALAPLSRSATSETEAFLTREAGRGVSTVGAWVTLGERRVLFVGADLQSGGWPGSLQDRLRAVQAGVIRMHVAEELLASPGPVVVGGDLNLVASRMPLFSLVRSFDVDGSDLVPVDAVRLGERSLATWRNPRDLFAPGRLDFILIPDAIMTAANSFVFGTEDLDDATLEGLGLEPDMSERLSDHLPVVADLRFGTTEPQQTPPTLPPTRD